MHSRGAGDSLFTRFLHSQIVTIKYYPPVLKVFFFWAYSSVVVPTHLIFLFFLHIVGCRLTRGPCCPLGAGGIVTGDLAYLCFTRKTETTHFCGMTGKLLKNTQV